MVTLYFILSSETIVTTKCTKNNVLTLNLFSMKYQIEYKGQLRCESRHEGNQCELATDAPKDNNGKGESYSPTDLVAAALSTCMITVIGIWCKKNGVEDPRMSCETEKVMLSNPRRIGSIRTSLVISTKVELTSETQRLISRVAEECPVAKSLHPDLKQELAISFRTYS